MTTPIFTGTIDNKGKLILISRAELLWLNKHGYKEAPAELRESLLILSKLEVKTSKRLKHRE